MTTLPLQDIDPSLSALTGGLNNVISGVNQLAPPMMEPPLTGSFDDLTDPIEAALVATQQNFQQLAQFLTDLFGGTAPRIRWGAATVPFPGGSQNGTAQTVNHGLGRAPAGLYHGESAAPWLSVNFSSIGNTQFTVNVRTTDGSSPANTVTATVYWLALG